jgi:prepilin-type N-terminal cleavage/methylation domain-containing protein
MNAPNAPRRDERGFTLAELLITIAILGLVMAAVLGVQMTSSTMFLRGENQAEAQQAARAALLMEEDLRMVRYGCPDLGCPTPPPAGAQQAISVASTTSITFWADTLNASTMLSAAVAAGAVALPVVDASGVNVNDRIYLNNGGTWETRVVTAKAGNTLTVAALTAVNGYPQGTQVGRPRQIVYTFTAATGTLTKDSGDGNGVQTLATGITGLTYSFYDASDILISPANPVANPQSIRRILIQTTTRSALASGGGASTFQINTNVRPRNL